MRKFVSNVVRLHTPWIHPPTCCLSVNKQTNQLQCVCTPFCFRRLSVYCVRFIQKDWNDEDIWSYDFLFAAFLICHIECRHFATGDKQAKKYSDKIWPQYLCASTIRIFFFIVRQTSAQPWTKTMKTWKCTPHQNMVCVCNEQWAMSIPEQFLYDVNDCSVAF